MRLRVEQEPSSNEMLVFFLLLGTLLNVGRFQLHCICRRPSVWQSIH